MTAKPAGLTTEATRVALQRDGPNEVPAAHRTHLAFRIGRQLLDPLVLLLLVVVNTTVGVIHEVRADRAIAALQRLGAPSARVVRDDTVRVVPAAALVRADVVRPAAGDVVPADAPPRRTRVRVDESALTASPRSSRRPVPIPPPLQCRPSRLGRVPGLVVAASAVLMLAAVLVAPLRTLPGTSIPCRPVGCSPGPS